MRGADARGRSPSNISRKRAFCLILLISSPPSNKYAPVVVLWTGAVDCCRIGTSPSPSTQWASAPVVVDGSVSTPAWSAAPPLPSAPHGVHGVEGDA